jgi:hypothetical protein
LLTNGIIEVPSVSASNLETKDSALGYAAFSVSAEIELIEIPA